MWGKFMLEVTVGQKRCMVGSLDSWKVFGSSLFSCTILLQFLLAWLSVNFFVTIMLYFNNSFRILSCQKTFFSGVFNQGLVWRWSSCFSRWKRWPYALCMGQWTLKFSFGMTTSLFLVDVDVIYYLFMVFVFVVIIRVMLL